MGYLRVANISKAYKRFHRKWGRLAEWLGAGVHHEPIWVLQNVSFDVDPGQAVGIIGSNGAGKSTLLKIITGTTRATSGSVQAGGRISALLELGMGFHPEFTGRQNCRTAGQLHGLRSSEIEDLLPAIADFAEIGAYFDQPVRTYSSGMQVRLAFSLATAKRPDILIVDEALSVGDTYFQHKSFDRIRRFRDQGTTLLFVSHDRNAVQSLCDRALLLEQGEVIRDGNPEEVTDYYSALIALKENSSLVVRELENGKKQTVSGTGEARVASISLHDASGSAVEHVAVGEPVELRITVDVRHNLESLVLGYAIKDRLGQIVYGTNTWHTGQVIQGASAGDGYDFSIAFPANLGPGSYSIVTALTDRETHMTANYEWRELALIFTVSNTNRTEFIGLSWIEPDIEVRKHAG